MKKIFAFFLFALISFAACADFDRTDSADLQALNDEVNNDPASRGYAAVIADTAALLSLINGAVSGVPIGHPSVTAAEIVSATTYDAYNDLAIDEQEFIRWVTTSSEIVVVTEDLRLQLTGTTVPGSQSGPSSWWSAATRTAMVVAMAAILDKEASRAETLFGYGTHISRDDWIAARDI